MATNLIVGNDGSNTLQGTAGQDLIYGFDPDGPQGTVTSIVATRVATGIQGVPLFATAPQGDTGRLFIVTQAGVIKILDLNTGVMQATPFLTVPVDNSGERGLLGLAFDPDFATNGFFYVYRTVAGSPAHNEVDRYQVDPSQSQPCPANRNTHHQPWQPVGRDQSQRRVDRLRTGRRPLYRDRRERKPFERTDSRQRPRQDSPHRRP